MIRREVSENFVLYTSLFWHTLSSQSQRLFHKKLMSFFFSCPPRNTVKPVLISQSSIERPPCTSILLSEACSQLKVARKCHWFQLWCHCKFPKTVNSYGSTRKTFYSTAIYTEIFTIKRYVSFLKNNSLIQNVLFVDVSEEKLEKLLFACGILLKPSEHVF